MPLLGFGPVEVPQAELLDRLSRGATLGGHATLATDTEHGRILLTAQSGGDVGARFVVECSRDGHVTVWPEGRDVLRTGDVFVVSHAMRREWGALAMDLERMMASP